MSLIQNTLQPSLYLPSNFSTILGWLTIEEAFFLQQMTWFASGLPGCLVEIGSYCGRSAVAIGEALRQGCCGKLYCVDPQVDNKEVYGIDSLGEFLYNTKELNKLGFVYGLRSTSVNAAESFNFNVKMLFIDGLHDYENVKQDFTLWIPKVIKQGFVLFHDSFEDGPQQVISEALQSNPQEWLCVNQVGTITVLKRCFNEK